MAGEIVNLRRARKAKIKADASADADQNRIAHGLTKQQKAEAKRTKSALSKAVDSHKRER